MVCKGFSNLVPVALYVAVLLAAVSRGVLSGFRGHSGRFLGLNVGKGSGRGFLTQALNAGANLAQSRPVVPRPDQPFLSRGPGGGEGLTALLGGLWCGCEEGL